MYRKMMICKKILMMIDVSKEINLIKKSSGSLLDESNPPAMKEEVLEQNSWTEQLKIILMRKQMLHNYKSTWEAL